MKTRYNLYTVIKKIHLYASLSIVALLMMYLLTSFMMIYHDYFKVERLNKKISFAVDTEELSDANWTSFLNEHRIKGRLTQEYFEDSGNLVRSYQKVGKSYKVVILKDKDSVQIHTTELNLSGKLIGFHRLRGYGGGIQYNIYAILLDLTGISLILFAVTGVILWLKLLKFNKIAWSILILGFVYVGSVVCYLMFK